MKIKAILVLAVLMLMTASSGYAAQESNGNAVVNGLGKILNFPLAMLDKTGKPRENSGPVSANEDVAVSEAYNLDAETTG